MDNYTLAFSAILSGLVIALTFIAGYYQGRKDQTPGGRK